MRGVLLVTLIAACAGDRAQRPREGGAAGEPEAPLSKRRSSMVVEGGFAVPESVVWDEVADVYLVSNVNGGATDHDDNGFIARVAPPPDLRVLDPAWIDGAAPEIALDGPKGMAIAGDVLYVADIDRVRMFDRATGAPRGEVVLPGALFLNDVTVAGGVVYATDTGVDARLEPTTVQNVWAIEGGVPRPVASGAVLGGPNGVVVADGAVWVVGFVDGTLYRLAPDGRTVGEALPEGTLDGIVVLPDGRFAVTSWEAAGVFVGRPGAWRLAIEDVPSPADLGIDAKRGLLLIPSFAENRVEVRQIPE